MSGVKAFKKKKTSAANNQSYKIKPFKFLEKKKKTYTKLKVSYWPWAV